MTATEYNGQNGTKFVPIKNLALKYWRDPHVRTQFPSLSRVAEKVFRSSFTLKIMFSFSKLNQLQAVWNEFSVELVFGAEAREQQQMRLVYNHKCWEQVTLLNFSVIVTKLQANCRTKRIIDRRVIKE